MAKVSNKGLSLNHEQKKVLAELSSQEIVITRRLHPGLSGAGVYLGHVDPKPLDSTSSEVVVKISSIDDEELEPKKHLSVQTGPLNPIVPKLVDSAVTGSYVAAVYTVAHGSLQSSASLEEHLNRQSGTQVTSVLTEYLQRWWSGAKAYAEPTALVRSLFKSSRIERIIQTARGLGASVDPQVNRRILFTGRNARPYPNPVFVLLEPSPLSGVESIAYPLGPGHGDLHVGNVLVPRENRKTPMLIDFAMYQPDICVFWDLLYLEFSILQKCYPVKRTSEREHWSEVVEFVGSNVELDVANYEGFATDGILLGNLLPLRQVARQVISSAPTDYEIAFHLTGIAVGLNWMSKRNISDELAVAALHYAASHMKKACTLLGATFSSGVDNIEWAQAQMTPALLQEIGRLERDLLPRLSGGPTILLLGGQANRTAGVPSDKDIARDVSAELHGKAVSIDTEDSDDPLWMEAIAVQGLDELVLRRIAKASDVPESQWQKARNVMGALAQHNWVVLLSFAFSAYLLEAYRELSAPRHVSLLVPHGTNVDSLDLSTGSPHYWVAMRGLSTDLSTLAIGQWDEKTHIEARRELWSCVSRTVHPGLTFVMLGFSESSSVPVVREILTYFPKGTDLWIVSERVKMDETRGALYYCRSS